MKLIPGCCHEFLTEEEKIVFTAILLKFKAVWNPSEIISNKANKNDLVLFEQCYVIAIF